MTETAAKEKLSLVVYSGVFEKVHYAFVMAAGALAINRPTTLFFTMEASRALLADDGNGHPGWHGLATERPELTALERNQQFIESRVVDFESLFQSVVLLGGRFMVCEMGLHACGMDKARLRTDIEIELCGVVTFLNDTTPDGHTLFI